MLNRPFAVTTKYKRGALWLIITLIMLAYALRGFQEPWSFGYFQYALTWENGYMMRGFVGTVLHLLFGDNYYQTELIRWIIIAMGLLFIAYLCYVFYRLLYEDGNLFAALVLLIFSTSTFCMFHLAQTGFLDHILYLLTAIFIEVALKCSLKTTVICGSITSGLCVVILSTGAFIVCPIIASICVIKLFLERAKEPTHNLLKPFFLIGITFIPILLLCVLFNLMSPDPDVLNQWLLASEQFPFYSPDFSSWMAFFNPELAGKANILIGKTWLYFEPHTAVYILLIIGLVVLYLYWIGAEKRVMIGYTFFCLLSSFTAYSIMYFGGSDFHRYYFSAFMSTFIISVFFLLHFRKCYITQRQGLALCVLTVLVLPRILFYRLWRWNVIYRPSPIKKLFAFILGL